ncbi:peptidase domain-containing ABC transporter [Phormidium tenue FACHB-886]|nr:peptidase domain-containing ABC transporter [Phormidium tenue FACHB-886]
MVNVDISINSFLSDFFKAFPFNYLPDKLRSQVAAKLQLCSFRPGAVIYPAGELPSAIHCVVQGRVRILGSALPQNPATAATLAVVGKGTVVGAESLLRRVAAGSVRAALSAPAAPELAASGAAEAVSEAPKDKLAEGEVLTLALPADEFEALALKHLLAPLAQQVSLIELFDTIDQFLGWMPTPFAKEDLIEVIHYIEQHQLAVVQNWFPTAKSDALKLSNDRVWLVSGGAPVNVPIGTPVTLVGQIQPTRSSPFPVRLLGIERNFWTSTILNGKKPGADMPVGTLPSPAASAPPALPPAPPQKELPSQSYPVRRSPFPDPVEDVVACFAMVCAYLKVPYRPDSLRRWLSQKSIDDFDPIELCVRVAQAIGFNAEVVRFTPTAGGINRIAVPALLRCRGIPVVLYEATPTATIIGSPRTGLLRLTATELAARLTPSPQHDAEPVCRAIVLERLPQTPVKRFGFSWFFPVLAKQRGVLIQVLFASVFVQLLSLANPLLIQQVIDQVIVSANLSAMTVFGGLMIAFAVLEGALSILRMYLFANTAHRIDLRLSAEIIRHLLRLPLPFFEKRPVGELSARLSELENIRQFLTGTALTAVLDVLFSVFYIAVMFLYSTPLTFCVLLSVPVVVASTLIVAAIQEKLIRVKSDRSAQVQSYLIETLSGIFTVKAQHMEALVEATWRERYVQYLSTGFTTSTVSTVFSSFSTFLNTMSNLLVLWVGAGLVLEGQLSLGGLIAFRILTGYVTGPLLRLAHLWQRFQETSLSMELLADIVDSPTEELSEQEAQLELPTLAGRVEYHEVSFGFNPGQLQLANVSLEVATGSFVGIVGQSGSGKSTLLKLLPRLYLPQSGQILIDGYDISKVSLGSLRRQIGIVPQDAVLFEGTIRDNIALFGDISDDLVLEAAKVAEAHDFIMQLPDAYNSRVGERGASLSGGQRQRIAIARAVARNPRLLIFDEATSALDYETERRVCENLMRKFHDRTCFFITHRLSTLTNADRILFMQAGVIAEQGTHQELMMQRQLYYCLYTQQTR